MNSELTLQLVDHHRQFLGFLERRLGDQALAEDILQDAFVKSLEKPDDARDETSSVAWFYRTLRNAVIDHYRRNGARNRALEALAREMEGAVEPPSELRDAICGCITRLAATLKPEYEQAIRRIDVDDVSVQAFAEEAGITPNNASVRVFRAREALRKQVKTSCGTCAEHGCLECSCGKPAATARAATVTLSIGAARLVRDSERR
jgi:RNA polymerase sigma factor, sigma-70 family